MTQNLKIEVLTGDISNDGTVVTNLVTKEELSTAIVKKADLGTDGKIPTSQLPAEIVNTAGIVDEVKLQLETSIKDAVDKSNAYAESYTDNALSSKADLTSGKVPLEQLPAIDQYPQFGTALSNLSTSILTSVKQRTDQLEKTKADLGEDGKVLREQIPSYEKISGLPEQLEVMSTQTAAVSGELDQHKLQTADQIDTLKENIEANVQQLTDRQSHLMRSYATKELGVDAKVGVKPGEYFYVRSTNEEEMLVEYQNVGRVATTTGKSYPSASIIVTKEKILDESGVAVAKKVFDGSRSQEEININTVDFSYFLDPNKTITFNANNGNITTQLQALKTLIQPHTKVKFPYGDFTVSDEVNFTQDGIWLDGENTRITQTGTNKKIFKSAGTKGFRVSGFELIGKGTEYGGISTSYNGVAAVFLDSCENARIYDNTIRNFAGGGIRWTGYAIGHRIINNDIVGIGAEGGIVIGDNFSDFAIGAYVSANDQDILIQGNNISKHCFGIGISKGAGCQITLNTIHDIIGQHGMYLSNPSLVTVVGNRLRNIALEGIKIQLASSGIVSDDLLVSANIVNNTGGSGIVLGSTSVVSGAFFNNLVVTNNKIKNAGSYGINIDTAKELICTENSVDGAGAYGVIINESYGELSRNVIKRSQWAGIYASITDDLHFSDNHVEDVVLNAVGEVGQPRNYYYVQIGKNVNATGTPKLFYSDNKLIKKASNPSEFEGTAGRSLRVTTGIDVYHTGDNYNLTGKAMQLTDLFLKAFDIGISPNVDNVVTGNLNPSTPIYGDGRRRLYSNQDPVTAGMPDTFRIGDRVYHTQPTSFIGWVLTASGWKTFGSVTISNSVTYDPPSLTAAGTVGDSVTTTVPLAGAVLGMVVKASFDKYSAAVEITEQVSAANAVTVRFKNTSNAAVDLASGTLTVRSL